jgi:hypothetical protein
MTTPTREQVVQWAKDAVTKTVDWDLTGKPITDADVLLMGAFGPLMERIVVIARADLEAQLKAAQEEHINQMSAVQLRLAEMKDQLASAEQRTAEAIATWCEEAKGKSRDARFRSAITIVAGEIRSGEWRKFVKGE